LKKMNQRIAVLALALLIPSGPTRADPFASEWAPSAKSQARLIADGTGQAGLQIELAAGAITYWRDPGDAGVPPTFDFSRSANVASATVDFPAPKRIVESDGSEAFGYERGVLFPIRVKAADPAKPVTLALDANYAVCEKICLPARAAVALELPKRAPTPWAAEIDAARAVVPVAKDAAALGVELTAMEGRNWRLCLPAAPGAPRDLFVEPPEGWWLTAKAEGGEKGRDCFALSLKQAPADVRFPAEVKATITGGGGAVETVVKLERTP
jgi:DsbC/DsbD-like thiol-disulfide interchange protein